MAKLRDLKSAASSFLMWTIMATMFTKGILVPIIFGIGGLILWASHRARRREDLLVRAAGFMVMALASLLAGDGWLTRFLALSFGGVSIAYLMVYAFYRLTGSDFLERYFLVLAGSVVLSALLASYPHPGTVLFALFYLLVASAIVYLTYLTVTYVSARIGKVELDPLPPTSPNPKEDAYTLDLRRVVRAFVEKGDKTPLLVFILRHSPRGVLDVHLERAIRPLVEYRPPTNPLAPPWLEEKRALEEVRRRKKLVEEILKSIESLEGLE